MITIEQQPMNTASANTTYYVKVLILTEKWVDVQASNEHDARIHARQDYPETFMVLDVWSPCTVID